MACIIICPSNEDLKVGKYYHKRKFGQQEFILGANSDRITNQKRVYQYHCPIRKCKYFVNKKFFNSIKFLKQHYKKVHMSKDYICPKCKKEFPTESFLNSHEKICGLKFVCVCGSKHVTIEALTVHARRKKHMIGLNFKAMRAYAKSTKDGSVSTNDIIFSENLVQIKNSSVIEKCKNDQTILRKILPKSNLDENSKPQPEFRNKMRFKNSKSIEKKNSSVREKCKNDQTILRKILPKSNLDKNSEQPEFRNKITFKNSKSSEKKKVKEDNFKQKSKQTQTIMPKIFLKSSSVLNENSLEIPSEFSTNILDSVEHKETQTTLSQKFYTQTDKKNVSMQTLEHMKEDVNFRNSDEIENPDYEFMSSGTQTTPLGKDIDKYLTKFKNYLNDDIDNISDDSASPTDFNCKKQLLFSTDPNLASLENTDAAVFEEDENYNKLCTIETQTEMKNLDGLLNYLLDCGENSLTNYLDSETQTGFDDYFAASYSDTHTQTTESLFSDLEFVDIETQTQWSFFNN